MPISNANFQKFLDNIEKLVDKMDKILDSKTEVSSVKENKMSDFSMDYTPSPISRLPITTQNEALEEIMLRSGVMSREAWEKLRGVTYDDYGDTDDDDMLASGSVDDEEFSQSTYSSYYERKKPQLEVPNVETKSVDTATAISESQQSQVASSDSDNSGANKDDK